MVKVVIGRRPDTNPNCYQTTSDTWALSLRHDHMTIHDCTIYIHGSEQCSLSMMHEHMYLRDCSHVWCKIHGSEHYETRKGWEKISSNSFFSTSIGWSWVYWNTKRQKLILGSYVDPCIGYEGADPEICEQLVPPKWHHRGRGGEVLSEGKRTSVINISDAIVCWPLTLKRVCGCPVMAVTCASHWTKPQRT